MPEDEPDLREKLHELEKALKVETARRLSAEVALQAARADFKKALKSLPVIIFATDEDGSLVFFNREFERVSGYTAADLQDSPDLLELLFHQDDGVCVVNDATCRKWKMVSKDGQERVVVWSQASPDVPFAGWRSWKIGLDISELEAVREKVKILQGLLPICASCKKIRNDQGAWTQLETYIADRSEADFTHGICPECMRKLYPEIDKE
jgi:PAS domain S-box-containing protein